MPKFLLKNHFPSIDEVFSLIIHEEHQCSLSQLPTSVEYMVLLALTDQNKRSFERTRKKEGHGQRSLCTHCGFRGHTIDRCYKLHGFSPSYRSNSNSQKITNTTVQTRTASTQQMNNTGET